MMNIKKSLLLFLFCMQFLNCKKENKPVKYTYNQKANELIQQIISQENCSCVLEIPEIDFREIEIVEHRNLQYETQYMKKLSVKTKKELDSLFDISKNFKLDLNYLKSEKINLIPRDSARIINKNSILSNKLCPNRIIFLTKPVFNKTFDKAVINFGPAFICVGVGSKTFKFNNNNNNNNKWEEELRK